MVTKTHKRRNSRLIRVRDLPVNANGEMLYCQQCGDEWSATQGDYWQLPKGTVMCCGNCKKPMKLGRKVTRFVQMRR